MYAQLHAQHLCKPLSFGLALVSHRVATIAGSNGRQVDLSEWQFSFSNRSTESEVKVKMKCKTDCAGVKPQNSKSSLGILMRCDKTLGAPFVLKSDP